jgi:hypothetical protein
MSYPKDKVANESEYKTSRSQVFPAAGGQGSEKLLRGVHGFPSPGRQELCAFYKRDKVNLKHTPVRSQSVSAMLVDYNPKKNGVPGGDFHGRILILIRRMISLSC